jgi:hypothetical protein
MRIRIRHNNTPSVILPMMANKNPESALLHLMASGVVLQIIIKPAYAAGTDILLSPQIKKAAVFSESAAIGI